MRYLVAATTPIASLSRSADFITCAKPASARSPSAWHL
jgi:hypothetical protein